MSRRCPPLILRLATLAAAALCATACGDETGQRPNIVLILADDLGYGDATCYNPEARLSTPNIDRLAAEGMRFTQAYAPASVCTPSRYGLLTGRYCWRSRLTRGVLMTYSPALIAAGEPTLASLLHDRGYGTAAVGKWHLGLGWQTSKGEPVDMTSPDSRADVDFTRPITEGPLDIGFDEFFGIPLSADFGGYYYIDGRFTVGVPNLPKGHDHLPPRYRLQEDGVTTPGWRDDALDVDFTNRAVTFLNRHVAATPDRPFFLFLSLNAPHEPLDPPDFVRGTSRAGRRGDMCQLVDWTVGEITAALERLGVADDTLLIFTSDNGPVPGDRRELAEGEEYQHYGHPDNYETFGHAAAGGLRGSKFMIYEGGLRVPFVVRWPGQVAPGSNCDDVVCLTDLFATFAAITGRPAAVDTAPDSFDISPLLRGQPAAPVRKATVLHSAWGLFAIRQGPWKLILGEGDGGLRWDFQRLANAPPRLYNLDDDPGESTDVSAQHPEVVDRLSRLLADYRERGSSR